MGVGDWSVFVTVVGGWMTVLCVGSDWSVLFSVVAIGGVVLAPSVNFCVVMRRLLNFRLLSFSSLATFCARRVSGDTVVVVCGC